MSSAVILPEFNAVVKAFWAALMAATSGPFGTTGAAAVGATGATGATVDGGTYAPAGVGGLIALAPVVAATAGLIAGLIAALVLAT